MHQPPILQLALVGVQNASHGVSRTSGTGGIRPRAIGVTESEGERSICFTNTGKERKLVAASWDSVTNTQTLYNQKSTPFGA